MNNNIKIEMNANKNNTQHIQKAVLVINCCGNLKEVEFTQPKQKQEPFVKGLPDEPLRFPANDRNKNVGLEFETNGDWDIVCSGPNEFSCVIFIARIIISEKCGEE